MGNKSSNSSSSGNKYTTTTTRKCSTLLSVGLDPGVIGLRNHGNTCFINAILQCLSHTELLAEYFVSDQYQSDLNWQSRVNIHKCGGTEGEITEQLAELLKALWSSQYKPEMTSKFKSVIDSYWTQGAAQHDAQEFLLWLLDNVHEDLNTATKKKYVKVKNSYGRPDEVVATETMANHLRCNSSFVHKLFQAQFYSSLTCTHCHRQISTFDPFLCISLPIPHKQSDDEDLIEEYSSESQLKATNEECTSVTLEECFQLYTQAEQLGPENAWHCPSCNRKQEVVKRLALWSSPDILIVHLKRFKRSAKSRTMAKLSVMIDFPVHGLDLTNYMASRSHSTRINSQQDIQINGYNNHHPGEVGWRSLWSPLRMRSCFWSTTNTSISQNTKSLSNNSPNRSGSDEHVYDLYAVCNHHGSGLVGGHYTAYCRNPTDGVWYLFDDTYVSRVKESEIVTASAYILFYQRRSLSTSSGSSDEASSNSSSGSEHWASPLSRGELHHQPSFLYSKRGSTESFSRKDRLYSTLPVGSVDRGMRIFTNLARNEESNYWSDDDAVDLNGDWGTPEAPRRSETTHAQY